MSDAVPAWAYEKAEILPHDPQFAERARTERDRLARSLAPWLVDGVEHVGSTAAPGLAAKPVIDLMASVTDPDALKQRLAAQHPGDREAYTDAKTEFVADAVRQAGGPVSTKRQQPHSPVLTFDDQPRADDLPERHT